MSFAQSPLSIEKDEKKKEKTLSLIDFIDSEYLYAFNTGIDNLISLIHSKNYSAFETETKSMTSAQKISCLMRYFDKYCNGNADTDKFLDTLCEIFNKDAESLAITLIQCRKIQTVKGSEKLENLSIFRILFNRADSYDYRQKDRKTRVEIFKLLHDSKQIKNILKFFLQTESDNSLRFLKYIKLLSLDYSKPLIKKPSLLGSWEYDNDHRLMIDHERGSNYLFPLMNPTFITERLKGLFTQGNNFSESRFEYSSWFFEVLSHFKQSNVPETLPFIADLNHIILDYLDEQEEASQIAYDQLLLETHNNKNFLILIFKYYKKPIYQTDHPFNQFLHKLSKNKLQKKLQDNDFSKLILKHPKLYNYILCFAKDVNPEREIKDFLPQKPSTDEKPHTTHSSALKIQDPYSTLNVTNIVNLIEKTDTLSEAAVKNDYQTYRLLLMNLKKYTLDKDDKIAEISDHSISFFLKISNREHTKQELITNFYEAFFKELSQKQARKFLYTYKLKNFPAISFIALLQAINTLDPLIKIKLLHIIFKTMSNEEIANQLKQIPAEQARDFLKLYSPKVNKNNQSLIHQLDQYINKNRNPLRMIQALRARFYLADDTEKEKNIGMLSTLIKEIQTDHDQKRYRILGTKSRLVKVLLQAHEIMSPTPRNRCQKIRLFFSTTNDKAHALEDKKSNQALDARVFR